jgi:dienelactone hydrolase
MKLKLLASVLALWPVLSMAAIKTEPVDYKDGDVELQGFIVYDDAQEGKRPGVVVYPEWWGLTDYPKHRAQALARLGYVAFAADMYGKGVTTEDPKKAGELAGPIRGDRQMMRRRALLAIDQIKKSDKVDGDQLAAIGYCFGGTCALELARAGSPLQGVVSFHGGLDTPSPAESGKVKAKILVLTGGADQMVPPDQLVAFGGEMTDAKADWQVNVYSGAKHAFTNPDADKFNIPGIAYDKQADRRSWTAMRAFFAEIFPNNKPKTPGKQQ